MKKILFSYFLSLFLLFATSFSQTNETDSKTIILKIKGNYLQKHSDVLSIDEISSNPLKKILSKYNVLKIEKVFSGSKPTDTIGTDFHGRKVKLKDISGWIRLEFPSSVNLDSILTYLKKIKEVENAHRDGFIHKTRIFPNELQTAETQRNQWGLYNPDGRVNDIGQDINVTAAWEYQKGRSDVVVAIIDDGVDHSHLDLDPGDRSRVIVGRNVIYGNNDTRPTTTNGITESHGTNIAGVIGAITNNGSVYGANSVAGIMWNCKILPVKSSGRTSHNAAAVDWASQNGAHIINMSFNIDPAFDFGDMADAISNAYVRGTILCASMGNDGDGTVRYPAAFEGVIAVGGTDKNDDRRTTSNFGNHISVMAPGTGYRTTNPNGTYIDNFGGTSLSAPIVAGASGLILSHSLDNNLNLSNDDVKYILESTADKVTGMGGQNWTDRYGYGRINVGKAIQQISSPYSVLRSVSRGDVTLIGQYSKYQFAFNIYLNVKKYKVSKHITYPYPYTNPPLVWVRNRESGWSPDNPNPTTYYSRVSNVTNTGFDFETYFYWIGYDELGYPIQGYYPRDPYNADIGYTVIGEKQDLATVLSTTQSGTIYVDGTQSVNGYLTVNANVTLQLNPGATLQFNSSGRLLVYGTLNLNGTSSSHVTLDGQNNARSGITNAMVVVASGGTANIQYADFKNAGYGLTLWNNYNTVTVQNCSFKNFGFASDSKALTVYSTTGTTTISNNTFTGSNSQGLGIYSYNTGTNISISSNTITSAGTGIHCYSSNALLTGNNVQSNSYYGIQSDYLTGYNAVYRNNNIRSNGYGISLNAASPWIVGNTIIYNGRNVFITSSSPNFAELPNGGNPGPGHNVIAMSGSPLVDVQNSSFPFFGYYSASAQGGYNSFYDTDLPHIRAQYSSGVWADVNYWGIDGPANYPDGTSWVRSWYPLDYDSNPYPLAKSSQVFASQNSKSVQTSSINSTNAELDTAIAEGFKGNYNKAKQILKLFVDNKPSDKFSPLALLLLYDFSKIESHKDTSARIKNENEFSVLVDGLKRKNANHPLRPFALRLLARDAAITKDYIKANALYDELLNTYPNSRFELATLYDKVMNLIEVVHDLPKAKELVAKMVANYPKDELTVMGRIAIGEKVDFSKSFRRQPQDQLLKSIIAQFSLGAAFPNPFNPSTNISFEIPTASFVRLVVYDILGREVVQLVNEEKTSGRHTVAFDGNNLPSGVYLYRLEAGENVAVAKMLLTK